MTIYNQRVNITTKFHLYCYKVYAPLHAYLQRDRLIDYIYLWVWWRQLILHYRDTAPATDPPTPPSWTEWTARYSISGPGRRWTRVSKTRSRDTGDAEKNVMPPIICSSRRLIIPCLLHAWCERLSTLWGNNPHISVH